MILTQDQRNTLNEAIVFIRVQGGAALSEELQALSMVMAKQSAQATAELYPDHQAITGYAPCTDCEEQLRTVVNDTLEVAALICDEQANEPECQERATYCADAIRAKKTVPA